MTSLNQLIPFNIISLLSVFLTSIPILIGAFIVLYEYDSKDQLFISAIDCIIISGLMVVALLWEGQKNE